MTETLDFVEVQGSGEEAVFSADEMSSMLELSRKGVTEIISLQKAAILTVDRAAPADLASLAAAFSR
jgi:ribonuclease PH